MSELRCYQCNLILPRQYALGSDDAWNMMNVSPDAASGGVLMPMHDRCRRANVFPWTRKFDNGSKSQ